MIERESSDFENPKALLVAADSRSARPEKMGRNEEAEDGGSRAKEYQLDRQRVGDRRKTMAGYLAAVTAMKSVSAGTPKKGNRLSSSECIC